MSRSRKIATCVVGVALISALLITVSKRDVDDDVSPSIPERALAQSQGASSRRLRPVDDTQPSEVTANREIGVAEGAVSSDTVDDWATRFWSGDDHWQFVQQAVPAAMKGDARAQFFVAGALLDCHSQVSVYQALYGDQGMPPEEMIESLIMENFHSSVPAHIRDMKRREFERCAGFFQGDPPALASLPPREGGYEHEYWMARALENGDALARVQESLRLTMSLDSVDEGSKLEAKAKIRENLATAARSADPTMMFLLGNYLTVPSVKSEPLEGIAWLIAACQSGFDCSVSNPIVGNTCASRGLCNVGDSVLNNLQIDLGPRYGDAYARAQEIRFGYDTGDIDRVIDDMLGTLRLE